MAKTKIKKITATDILNAMEIEESKYSSVRIGEGENQVVFMVKPKLSLAERGGMVADIASMVFMETEDGEIEYCPFLLNFARNYSIVNYFTNISMPTGGEKTEDFLVKTNIINIILSEGGHFLTEHISDILSEADKLIEFRKQELLKKSKLDKLIDNISDIVDTVKGKTDGADLTQILDYLQKDSPGLKVDMEKLLKDEAASFIIK